MHGVVGLDIGQVFGRVLREKRKEVGLTQEQLALEADVQRNYVSLMERGVHLPTIAVLFKLAAPLRCSPSLIIQCVESEMVEQAGTVIDSH